MDFYKLTNFQLYSIINSRHLDKASKEQAQREWERRNLSDEEIEQLKNELAEKTKQVPPAFSGLSPNILYLIGAVILIFLLRQCVVAH